MPSSFDAISRCPMLIFSAYFNNLLYIRMKRGVRFDGIRTEYGRLRSYSATSFLLLEDMRRADDDILHRTVVLVCFDKRHLFDHIQSFDHFAKDRDRTI